MIYIIIMLPTIACFHNESQCKTKISFLYDFLNRPNKPSPICCFLKSLVGIRIYVPVGWIMCIQSSEIRFADEASHKTLKKLSQIIIMHVRIQLCMYLHAARFMYLITTFFLTYTIVWISYTILIVSIIETHLHNSKLYI